MDNFDLFDLKPSKATRQKRRDKRLHEEVIETGRFKTAKSARNIKKWNDSGRKKTIQQESSIDSLRKRESIRDGRIVQLRDNLEPLERWLFSQVGRPWAQVYAQLGKIANPNSMHGAHIRQHLWQYVAHKSWFDEAGAIVVADRFGNLSNSRYGYSDYFIHPKTGLFSIISEKKRDKSIGLFPKKARFKKEKQSLKSKIRQGIAVRPAPEKPGIDVKNWPAIRTRIKWVAPGDRLDFMENGEIFRAIVVDAAELESRGNYLVSHRRWPVFREKHWLSLNVKIVAVFAGTTYKAGQAANFSVNKNEPADWAAFDEGRLFGNRGFGFKHWALAQAGTAKKMPGK